MSRIAAETRLLDMYAETVRNLARGRWSRLAAAEAAVAGFNASGSAFGPTTAPVLDEIGLLLTDSALDAIGVEATAAAFRCADQLAGPGGTVSWRPTDRWIERERRRWVQGHHPGVAALVVPTGSEPGTLAARLASIDAILERMQRSGTASPPLVDALVAERRELLAGSVAALDALTDQIGAWTGSDNDPHLDALVRERIRIVDALVGSDPQSSSRLRQLLDRRVPAASALVTTLHDQDHRSRVAEVMAVEGVSQATAIEIVNDIDMRIATLVDAGHDPHDAVAASAIALGARLDLGTAERHAAVTGSSLVDALGDMAMARAMDLGLDELHALRGLRDNFAAFDAARTGRTDRRVSVRDLVHVVEHPEDHTAGQVLAARAILDTPLLRNRLDTASGNTDIVDPERFGHLQPGDGIISVHDLEAFAMGTHLNELLGPYAAALDTAARAGTPDGTISRRDLQAWLDDPATRRAPLELREGVRAMLDRGLFDRSWLERHRDDLALGAAVAAGGAIIVLTAGSATPVVVSLGGGFGAGAGSAGLTTYAINARSGNDLGDGMFPNALNGGLVAMTVAGLPGTLGSIRGGVDLENAIAVSVATAEVSGFVSSGGADLLVPEDWEEDVHRGAARINRAAWLAALGSTGVVVAGRLSVRWPTTSLEVDHGRRPRRHSVPG